MKTYVNPQFDYQRHPDQDSDSPVRHPVIVVGAGPVGLCTAIDLAARGLPVVLLDDDQTVSVGSRAVCHAKRSLEILDRLGCAQPVIDRGISWSRGRVFVREHEVYNFDLLPEAGHERPAFVNLQQFHLEEVLVARAQALATLQLRWKNRVTGIQTDATGATLTIETPDDSYRLRGDWVVVCDGARSPVRHLMGLESQGQVFRDRFLIADVLMKSDYPTERWFWFDPPFHPGQSVLLHRQADNVWRVDFQLGWDADPELEKQPERVLPRLKAMLGDRDFDLEWVSVYTFQCRRMARFRHGHVLFAGDAAHQVSPFGARGANSGVQDADALAWRLAGVLTGEATDAVLDHWAHERERAADENILNSTRSTDFITPKSTVARAFRDATLALAGNMPFARRLVNSGRLSVPTVANDSPGITPDATPTANTPPAFSAPGMRPGAPSVDAPLLTVQGESTWWLRRLSGGFDLLLFADAEQDMPALDATLAQLASQLRAHGLPMPVVHGVLASGQSRAPVGVQCSIDWLIDTEGLLTRRCGARPGSTYLLRPDQHVCGRWPSLEAAGVVAAVARALGHSRSTEGHA